MSDTPLCTACGHPLARHRRNPYGMGCVVETDECRAINEAREVIERIAQGNGREGSSACAKCGCAFYAADGSDSCAPCAGKVQQCATCAVWFAPPGKCPMCEPERFELELDPFERIEKAAAEWRNAYRALERGDVHGVQMHAHCAIAHGLKLSQGLR